MPRYSYIAKDIQGKTRKGMANAVSEAQLVTDLAAEKLYMISCKEDVAKANGRRMKAKRLAEFNLQIGTMLSSGVTLDGAMEIMLQRDLKKDDRAFYEQMYEHMRAGKSLAETAQAMGNVFPPLLINMYISGEVNGTLDTTCIRMAEHYQKENKLNAKVRSAMMYPLFLLGLLFAVMMVIFNFVLPTFLNLYGDMELPAITKGIIAFSKLFTDYWLYTLIVIALVIAGFKLLKQWDKFAVAFDHFKIKLPIIGKLLKTIYTARFARTFSSLYSTGITILNGLEVSRGTIGNQFIAKQFEKAIDEVRAGHPLSEVIKAINGYDAKLASMMLIGEETGRLDYLLETTAESFDYEAERATERLVGIIEPLMIVIMAILVGLVMVGVMLPIYSMYGNISAGGGL